MQAVFLDLDGCLVDSTVAIPSAYNEALLALGVPAQPAASLRRFIGPPLLEGFTTLLAELGEDPDRAHDAIAAYRAAYAEVAAVETRLVPGIEAALDELPPLRLAVVTSKPAVFASPILEAVGLADRFEGIYAPLPEALTEPKAVALRRALAEVAPDVDPSRTAMVGDRSHDVLAGRELGTSTVGVTWGAGDRDELVAAGAEHVIDHPSQLAAALGLD